MVNLYLKSSVKLQRNVFSLDYFSIYNSFKFFIIWQHDGALQIGLIC